MNISIFHKYDVVVETKCIEAGTEHWINRTTYLLNGEKLLNWICKSLQDENISEIIVENNKIEIIMYDMLSNTAVEKIYKIKENGKNEHRAICN